MGDLFGDLGLGHGRLADGQITETAYNRQEQNDENKLEYLHIYGNPEAALGYVHGFFRNQPKPYTKKLTISITLG
jgi:hypothetical protein